MKLENLESGRSPFKVTSEATTSLYPGQDNAELITSVKFALFKELIGNARRFIESRGLMEWNDTTLQVFHPDISTEVVKAVRRNEHPADECVASGYYELKEGNTRTPQYGINLKYPMTGGPEFEKLEATIRALVFECLADQKRAKLEQGLVDIAVAQAEAKAAPKPPSIPSDALHQPTYSDLRRGDELVLRSAVG